MTDRIHALTVVLDQDYRTDDVEAIVNAIKMIRGVMVVEQHVSDHVSLMATVRARHELMDKIFAVLKGGS